MTSGLNYPNEAYRLANGHTLITDRDNNRVIEVDSGCNIVWSYTNLQGRHNGNRLANGNTLICDSEANNGHRGHTRGQRRLAVCDRPESGPAALSVCPTATR